MEGESKIAWGLVECIGLKESFYTHQTIKSDKKKETLKIDDHTQAVNLILKGLLDKETGSISDIKEIGVVGHRMVHGRDMFSESVVVNESVKEKIRECFDIAPLHNPANYAGLLAVEKSLSSIPSVLVFDTAFHQTMPAYAYMYGIPYEYYQKDHIRRYGFHGTSHKYVSHKAAAMLNKPIEELKIVVCHLGNGSSITAINKGKAVDTTMGFTPLPGIVMGTRCGDIDPGILLFLMEKYPQLKTSEALSSMLNKKSGLVGITGLSDMRAIIEAKNKGDKKAELGFEMLCYEAKKYIGSFFAALNGLDVVAFTAGIGENSYPVREAIVSNLENLGIEIDFEKNKKHSDQERFISKPNSKVKVAIIPTNEELMIAREAVETIEKK
jgi:acetate kinase